jgi:hypothetical protein
MDPVIIDKLPMWIKASTITTITLDNCENLPIDTKYNIPGINSAYGSWTSFTGQFDNWPIDISQVCGFNLRLKEIHGLGINPPNPPSYAGEYHNGVDFFAPLNSSIFAMGKGIVVGIAVDEDATETHQAWGGTLGKKARGYAVIIRHGHLYVLYGHLKTISDAIWVGAPVDAGMIIGTLGSFNEPHLHIEVHSYGATLPSKVIESGLSTGILPVNSSANDTVATYVYDVMQFLPNPQGYSATNILNIKDLVAEGNLSGTGDNKDAQFALNTGCSITYRTRVTSPIAAVKVNGYNYRGIDTYAGLIGRPRNPLPSPLLHTNQPE